jgi:hypothetical protein
VAELARRYREQLPAAASEPSGTEERGGMPAGAVFLSYASQDLPAVQAIHDALQKAGLDVWFDKAKLEGGDDWEQRIRQNIRACSLFIPVISNSTNSRAEGVFRQEWNVALKRAERFDPSATFIIPMTIDDFKTSEALVPDEFRRWHWIKINPYAIEPVIVQMIVQRVRDARKAQLRE